MIPLVVLGVVVVVVGAIGLGVSSARRVAAERDRRRLAELPTRGIRRRGRVRTVTPYIGNDSEALVQRGGAQLIVEVELDREGGGRDVVRCHLVEDADTARARIGTEVTVVEHPDAPELRQLDGHFPNGEPRRT